MINFRLTWHPQFSIHSIDTESTLFLAENEQYLLKNQEFHEINTLVNHRGMFSDYVLPHSDIAEQIARMERIDKLIQNNILIDSNTKQAPRYAIPAFTNSIKKLQCECHEIYLLSQHINTHQISHWLSSLSLPKNTTFVVVDDYLHPALAELNKSFMLQGKNWVIMKPVGQTPMIGPAFTPANINTPCYNCLYARLIQNTPVKEWLRRKTASPSHAATPILVDKITVESTLNNFKKHYLETAQATPTSDTSLYAINTETQHGAYHLVSKRPQCEVCGNPALFHEQNSAPIYLADSICQKNIDGGYRNVSRKNTLRNIKRLISPITGVITELTEVTNAKPGTMAIYQAAYYQNTYKEKRPTPDTFVQRSLGKGVSKLQARSSALGEALERQAAQYTGEEIFTYTQSQKLDGRALHPQQLTPFSENQYQRFSHEREVNLSNPQWVARHDHDTAIHWIRGWSITKAEYIYFPAAYCFANTPFDDQKYSLYTHNGNAAGNTLEEAILQGVLELIERDAAAIWWYNQIPRPEMSLDIIPHKNRRKIEKTLNSQWDYWVLDISHDIGAVSCVAIGRHKDTLHFVMGFGCHLDPSIACQRALTEMHQLITIKDKVSGPFDFNLIAPHPFLFPKRNTAKKTIADFNSLSSVNIKDDILYLSKELEKSKLELGVVNYTRADIFLKTLKVIVPGLNHFWPQLGNKRLYSVPVKLGWLSNALKEHELNTLALYL